MKEYIKPVSILLASILLSFMLGRCTKKCKTKKSDSDVHVDMADEYKERADKVRKEVDRLILELDTIRAKNINLQQLINESAEKHKRNRANGTYNASIDERLRTIDSIGNALYGS